VPEIKAALHDVEEDVKENALKDHGEKLRAFEDNTWHTH